MITKDIFNKIKAFILLICVFLTFIGTGCSYTKWQDGKLKVIATTTMLADLSRQIGGEKVSVIGIMNAGIDPHSYLPTAQNIARIKEADLVVYNGLHLEAKMSDVFEKLSYAVSASSAIKEIDFISNEENKDMKDPHIWYSVRMWKDVAKKVAESFIVKDEQNKQYYTQRLESYLIELGELEDYIHSSVLKIPQSSRVIITAHDAFSYLGREYGLEVRGLQGISTVAEADISKVNALASEIKSRQIKSVFVETSVNDKKMQSLIEAVKSGSDGFDIKIGGKLYSDALGDEKSGHSTYIAAFKHNIDTVVEGLK